jgi:copper homeostasis protein
MTRDALLEVCVGSAEDAIAAAAAGADRLELCSALCVGGLTPSPGALVQVKRSVRIPVMVMIRPRESGFCYNEREFAAMCHDATALLELGADGIVFGALQPAGKLDEVRCRRLVELAGRRQAVFHRAFDIVTDPLGALDRLIELDVTRVLTSGQRASAMEGCLQIAQFLERAAGRIEILAGGGLNEQNVAQFVQRSGCRQVHMSLSALQRDASIPDATPIQFSTPGEVSQQHYRAVDPGRVRKVLAELTRISRSAQDGS